MSNLETNRHTDAPNGAGDAAQSRTPLSRRTLIALGALCIASFLAHLSCYPQLPAMVPTHWDTAGNVDGWSSREATLVLDLLPLALLALLNIAPRIDPRGQAYGRMGTFYTGFVAVTTILLIAVTWITELTVFGIMPANGSPIGSLVVAAMGVGFILLGNYLPTIKRNYTFGIKTPWALDNDLNWRLTHRVGGIAMLIAGVASTASALFSRTLGGAAVVILIGSLLGAGFIAYVYSYLVFRNGNRPLRNR